MFKKFTALRQLAHRFLALTLIVAASITPAAAQYNSDELVWQATKWYAAIDPSYTRSDPAAFVQWVTSRAPSKCSKSPQLSYVDYNNTIGNYTYTGMRFVPLAGPSPYPGTYLYRRIFKYDAVFFGYKYRESLGRLVYGFYLGQAEKACGIAYF